MVRQHATKVVPVWYRRVRMVLRTGGLVLGMVVAAWLFTYLASVILAPFITYHQEAVALAEVKLLLKEKQEEKLRLEGKVKELQSPWGAIEESRRKGMVKDGEHAVMFNFHPSATQVTPPAAEFSSGHGHLWWLALLLLVISFFAGSSWLVRRRRLAPHRPAGTLTPRSELPRNRPPTDQ